MRRDLHYLRVGDRVIYETTGRVEHQLSEVRAMHARVRYIDTECDWQEWWHLGTGKLRTEAPEMQWHRLRRATINDIEWRDLHHLRVGDLVIREPGFDGEAGYAVGEVVLIRASIQGIDREPPPHSWWDVTTGLLANYPPDAAAAHRLRPASKDEIERLKCGERTRIPVNDSHGMPDSETLEAAFKSVLAELSGEEAPLRTSEGDEKENHR